MALVFLKENAISSRKQGPKESVEDFLIDLRTRGNSLNKPEAELVRLAMQGLTPEIRSLVMLHNPQTYFDLTEKAKMAEVSVNIPGGIKQSGIGKDTLLLAADSISG